MFLTLLSFPPARGLVAARGFIWLQRVGATLGAVRRRLTAGAPPAERGLQDCGFGRCGARACLPLSMWPLRRRGVEPTAPALKGIFFATEPEGRPPYAVSVMTRSSVSDIISEGSSCPQAFSGVLCLSLCLLKQSCWRGRSLVLKTSCNSETFN